MDNIFWIVQPTEKDKEKQMWGWSEYFLARGLREDIRLNGLRNKVFTQNIQS